MIFIIPISLIFIIIVVLGIAGARWIETELSGFLSFMGIFLLVCGTIAFFFLRWLFSEDKKPQENKNVPISEDESVCVVQFECPDCNCGIECEVDIGEEEIDVTCPDCGCNITVEIDNI